MSKILVTGSLAYDRIATFQDRFSKHILPEKIHKLNVAFNVEKLTVEFGGTGGNIAYSLVQLGESPLLLGTLGQDYEEYKTQLLKNNLETKYIHIIEDTLTANATIMTDLDDNQITAFYVGAMGNAHEAKPSEITEEIALAIISPNGIDAMRQYPAYFREKEIPFIADPGQSIPALSKDDLINLIEKSLILIANDYEWELIQQKTGLSLEETLQKTQNLIITYGEKGAKLWKQPQQPNTQPIPTEIPIFKPEQIVDPTGCGDAFRAGLIYGIKNRISIEKSAKIGSWIASKAVAQKGTQKHKVDEKEWESFLTQL